MMDKKEKQYVIKHNDKGNIRYVIFERTTTQHGFEGHAVNFQKATFNLDEATKLSKEQAEAFCILLNCNWFGATLKYYLEEYQEAKTCDGKIVEIEGKKYKLVEQ